MQLLRSLRQPSTSAPRIAAREFAGWLMLRLRELLPEPHRIAVHVIGDVPDIGADRVAVSAAVEALAENARDAMPRGGRLDVTLRPVWVAGDRHVCVALIDAGLGRPQAEIDAMLASAPGADASAGAAYAERLRFAARVARECGGSLAIESGLGYGACVGITLPAAD